MANYVAGLDFTILKSSVSLSVLERVAVSRRYSVNVVDLSLLATQIINLPLHGTVTRRFGVAGYITGNCSVTVPDVTLPRSLFQTFSTSSIHGVVPHLTSMDGGNAEGL